MFKTSKTKLKSLFGLTFLSLLLLSGSADAGDGLPGNHIGTSFGFGWNSKGQIQEPVRPTGTQWAAFSGGREHSIGLLDNGQAIGFGDNTDSRSTVPALPSGERYTAVSAGESHSLLLTSAGGIRAIGSNGSGQTNVPPLPDGLKYTAVAAGTSFSIAAVSDGTLRGWGWNNVGQTVVPDPPTGAKFISVAAGHGHAIGLLDNGKVETWGRNTETQLQIPVPVQGTRYIDIDASGNRTMALRSDGQIFGAGNAINGLKAPPAAPGFELYVDLALGDSHGLGLTNKGTVVGFGEGANGQLTPPFVQPSLQISSIAAGMNHSLAILARKPTVTATGSVAEITYGEPYSVTVKAESGGGSVTGSVNLLRSGTLTATDTLSSGQRKFTLNPEKLKIGSNFFTAEYEGDRRNVPAQSIATKVVVSKARPQLYLVTPKQNPNTADQLKLPLRVEAGTARLSGQIEVFDNGRSVGKVNLREADSGEATIKLPRFGSAGSHRLTAEYEGSDISEAASGAATVMVEKANPKLSLKLARKKVKPSQKVGLSLGLKVDELALSGTVTVSLGRRNLRTIKLGAKSERKLNLKLPALKRKGKQQLRVAYSGNSLVARTTKKVTVMVKK